MSGHGQKLNGKSEVLIAALLAEPTQAAAAKKASVSEATVGRWMRQPEFQRDYRRARRELVEGAIGRIQAAAGEAVDVLLEVARHGQKDGDRVRAATAILAHAIGGLADAGTIHGEEVGAGEPVGTADVVRILGNRLRQVDSAELPAAEKARLTASLADALLRAISVDVLDKRLEALQAVLAGRKDGGRRG